ncbi:UNVERIFIED_ORG: hypothetical protein J2Y84_002789 [Pseudomonas reinekei]|nr:hypothetical protein [Pseudomonas reinekei]
MVVNDNAFELDKRGALESIASKLAPTVSRVCVKNLISRHGGVHETRGDSLLRKPALVKPL